MGKKQDQPPRQNPALDAQHRCVVSPWDAPIHPPCRPGCFSNITELCGESGSVPGT